ncbi:MAG: DEAD/DEAH box helicase [Bacteroidota bacterium]
MEPTILLIQKVIFNDLDVDIAIGKIDSLISDANEPLKYRCVLRALKSLKEDNIVDFCGHIRQCMQYFQSGILISNELYDKIYMHKMPFGFIFDTTNNNIELTIEVNIANDIDDLRSSYSNIKSRRTKKSFGDGTLYRYLGYENYTSLSQKMLIYVISNMKKNETLLACLPTGGGKSLAWQLPALSNMYDGLIIVVVPTIALAIDHEISTKQLYAKCEFSSTFCAAYYSGIDQKNKNRIFEGIDNNTLSILYISPEALMHKEFKEKILASAKNSKISALVIDEAHLVVSWGIKFRPEFQLLGSFRNQIKELSESGLKTILLSATLTMEDTEILKIIFDDDFLTEFRADELRPEPKFYMHKCNDEEERKDILVKLVKQAPKPLIVYTSRPEIAKTYYNKLKELGFSYLELFTGETKNSDRERILEQWRKDEIDIIIATSAFGMGVDKEDIRTIITSYIPENVSRYYQEIGRAGRDGCTSLCYWLINETEDNEIINNLTKSSILTVDNIVKRWKAMYSNAKAGEGPNKVWLDVKIAPEHLKYETTGQQNAGWNKDVIIFMLKSNLLRIIDVDISSNNGYKMLVELVQISILENSEKLSTYLTNFRANERTRISEGIKSIKKLIKSAKKNCFSTIFIDEFPYAQEVCSGCPYCRNKSFGIAFKEGKIGIKSSKDNILDTNLINFNTPFQQIVISNKQILLQNSVYIKADKYTECFSYLIKNKVNIIITPNITKGEDILEAISIYEFNAYMILTLDEFMKIGYKWLNGVCAIIYNENEYLTDKYFDFSNKYIAKNQANRIIHIGPSSQYIKSEEKRLSDLADIEISYNFYVEGGK